MYERRVPSTIICKVAGLKLQGIAVSVTREQVAKNFNDYEISKNRISILAF